MDRNIESGLWIATRGLPSDSHEKLSSGSLFVNGNARVLDYPSFQETTGEATMSKLIKILLPMSLLIGAGQLAAADIEYGGLEPCMNGGVSSSGNFVSNAAERRFHAEEARSLAAEQEPCMNGEVSANGNFLSQILEDRFLAAAELEAEPCINGAVPASGILSSPLFKSPIIASSGR